MKLDELGCKKLQWETKIIEKGTRAQRVYLYCEMEIFGSVGNFRGYFHQAVSAQWEFEHLFNAESAQKKTKKQKQ